jgi:hypothetical protein
LENNRDKESVDNEEKAKETFAKELKKLLDSTFVLQLIENADKTSHYEM